MPSKTGRLAWHYQHGRKVSYPDRKAAERTRWRLMICCWQFGLSSYPCRWGPRWQDGRRGGQLHWHLGHRRKTGRTWLKVYVVWPYYRLRRRWRRPQERNKEMPRQNSPAGENKDKGKDTSRTGGADNRKVETEGAAGQAEKDDAAVSNSGYHGR